jgi:DNA damage-binding protein 1
LIKLHTKPLIETNSFVEILDTFTNLGPITDFAVMDMERQGQCQLVTCSGGDKDGSLRIIRSGIALHEEASIDLPHIKAVWAIKAQEKDEFHKYIVLNFVGKFFNLMT